MLENDPNASTTTTAADEAAPPAKAVRRRRATKATSAPDPAAPVLPEPSGSEPPAAELAAADLAAADLATPDPLGQGVGDDGETLAVPAKRVRKAPAKKAAPRKRVAKAVPVDDAPGADAPAEGGDEPTALSDVQPTLESPSEPSTEVVDDDLELDSPTSVEAAPADAPALVVEPPTASRTRRRRAPAAVTFQAPELPDAALSPEPSVGEESDPALETAAAPRRRRRAGTSGAISASALVPTLLAPEPAPGEPADAVEGEPGEATDGPDSDDDDRPRRRRRGRRGRGARRDEGDEATTEPGTESESASDDDAAPESEATEEPSDDDELEADGTKRRRRRRRRSGGAGAGAEETGDDVPTVVHVREPRAPRVRGASAADEDGVRGITGSTRMAAKRARRQEGRDSGRRRPPVLSEAEFLARREAVDRTMVVRQQGDRTQIAVLEDGVLVEHYVTKASAESYAGNVYLGKVQNVLPSMEAAFIDIGKGKNGVLYAGEVNYDAQLAGHGPRKIESVLKSGQDVLVQVSKDPIGHKGARLTSQVSLPGRYLVYVPEGSMTGISRKLPDTERSRLKAILKKIVPDDAGVIIRTAAEGASEEELTADVLRLQAQWEAIRTKSAAGGGPVLLHTEPDLVVRVVRDVFNEDFTSLVVQGDSEWDTIQEYVQFVAPDLAPRLSRHESDVDVFAAHRIDEQLAKALDRKVWLPSGGSLVIDRTEAMVVIDVNTGKYVGKGGNLEETVTRNNLEAAEEIARQLRLRDLGGIIVVDFIDMVLESNRDLVVRRLVECLGRDRTKHQVAEVTSLGLVQMTRKRVGQGLLESFSETCEACAGRGVIVHAAPVDAQRGEREDRAPRPPRDRDRDRDRDRARAAAGPALVAAASLRTEGLSSEDAEAAGAAPADAPADDAPAPSRGRRRRGGRGAGAAAAAAAAEAKLDADVVDDAAGVDDAPLDADVQDLADMAPDLVPELADQPTSAEEDRPVDAAVDVTAGEVTAGEVTAVDVAAVDVTAVDVAPVDVEQEPQPEAAPEAVEVDTVEDPGAETVPPVLEVDAVESVAESALPPDDDLESAALAPSPEPTAAPRRRRRATSRPAGPPAS